MAKKSAEAVDGQGGGAAADPSLEALESLGYEQARDELVEVVRRLETGGITLEESLALWERGEKLAGVCQRWLDGARARLDAVVQQQEGGGE
ncbi:exodeoxyribonuclease VII small subunit [Yinghuangia seranimata]|uniref:exodeoxyribonuclease VII small subunit n=1 Tax=Yinghuangia seranimata TaxID=408067 RepID=UPI00248C2B55|nr:exodeoxyribonuclease VII small subunit [Yinghuangia seranimata]MDI2128882.1 exodeoxyribonuclease VII small subunit [Yinghuangia seranimata]